MNGVLVNYILITEYQYVHTALICSDMNYINSNILSWNIIEKKSIWPRGTQTCVAGLSQQTCYAQDHLEHSYVC